jgi:hypothetical protein
LICGFCHKEIPEQVGVEDRQACGACLGGCRKVHCPFCGFANPAPGKYLKKLLKKERTK